MTYFDDPANIEQYVKLSEGYDGSLLIEALRKHLALKSTVLELGMGEGKDLALLGQYFQVTGSDASALFIERYLEHRPQADIVHLDANTLETTRQFNALYSNKVLHHLCPAQLGVSFRHQAQRLTKGGLTMHSFWLGDGAEDFAGDTFYYYQSQTVIQLMAPYFALLDCQSYDESEHNDSFYILSQKRES